MSPTAPDEWYQLTHKDPLKMVHGDPHLPICETCNCMMYVYTGTIRRHHRWIVFRCEAKPEEHCIEVYGLRIPDPEWCEILGGKQAAGVMILAQLMATDTKLNPDSLSGPQEFSLASLSVKEAQEWVRKFEYLSSVGLVHNLQVLEDSIKYTHDRQFLAEMALILSNTTNV